jgi:hypothetical protein
MTSNGPACGSVSLRSEVDLHILCMAPRIPYCRCFTLQTIITTLRTVMLPRRSLSLSVCWTFTWPFCIYHAGTVFISVSLFVCILYRLWGPTSLILNWFWMFLLPRVKRPERETEHSPLSTVRDWWSYIFFLLNDLMSGRGTGLRTRGHRSC